MLNKIYNRLFTNFGPQGWWPYTLDGKLHPTHHGRKPVTEKHRLEIMLSAILTQNTNWKNAEKAIFNLNKEKLISIEKIRRINEKKLAALIRPSGYFNQKAVKLKTLADFLTKNPIRALSKEKYIKLLRKNLLAIKGVGPETADSILLYALEKPVFVIDAYTKRIFSRIGYKESTYDELQELFMKELPQNVPLFKEYHALLVELAKRNCRKTPICETCPLLKVCAYGKSNKG